MARLATSQSPHKKQKMSDTRRVTRSQTAQVEPDDDFVLSDDEEAFEYESDMASGDIEQEEEEAQQEEEDEEMEVQDDDSEVGDSKRSEREVIVLSSDNEDVTIDEPPAGVPKSVGKGKMTARKQFAADVASLAQRFIETPDSVVRDLKRDEGEDTIRFTIQTPASGRLKLCLMFPEMSGYPSSHEVMCFTENEDVEAGAESALAEVAQLPRSADRSLEGIIEYLLHRIVRGEPSPFLDDKKESQGNETDEDGFDYDDDLIGVGPELSKNSELMKALRRDFKELIKEGYRPGFTRVSELDLVVSVSKKVHSLGVPPRALQAWDSELITGQVVYLVLLMNFGSNYPVNLDNLKRGEVNFKVGISSNYKPSKAAIAAAFRSHSSATYTKGDFQAISLSAPLDSLMFDKFQEILVTRRSNENCGWAAAEQHCLTPGKTVEAFDSKAGKIADKAEKEAGKSIALPKDPMKSITNNYPLLAFAYLVRRFVLCPRFCLICYKRCDEVFQALKPFVCDSSLCLFQLISLGLGPSLEHEITTNAAAVDLLVQLAFIGAKEGGLKGELLPTGLSLEVPSTKHDGSWVKGDPVEDFDSLSTEFEKQRGVASLISELPPISEMKNWLLGEDLTDDERTLKRSRKLADLRGGTISNSAWKLLRFIVASNTSYLKQIEDEDELIQGIPKEYRQFRLVVGSPAKEHLLAENVKLAQQKNANARTYPTLFAWHGSATKNWSSILREGLHFKTTVNGRAYGHGCYFAVDGAISLGHYSAPASSTWKNADFAIAKMAALAEIVNLPAEFVSSNPYLVVDKIEWIQCRYLVIQRGASYTAQETDSTAAASSSTSVDTVESSVKTLSLDPRFRLVLNQKALQIPDIVGKLENLEATLDDVEEELNDSDNELLREPTIVIDSSPPSTAARGSKSLRPKRTASSISSPKKQAASSSTTVSKKPVETFVPCDEERLKLVKLLPPPTNPSRTAMSMLQKEMKSMIQEQTKEGPTSAGFYFDPERSNDNLFAWVIELPRESFDQDLPLVKDMKTKDVKSILMEIRFGESFPFSPPFFRVVHPRFLPFIHGGGGHVTGGGSICMDLLTTDGWSASYSISAVLLQIRMAMSNLEPRPARLDPQNYNLPYSIDEAVQGFKRAAATHGWNGAISF